LSKLTLSQRDLRANSDTLNGPTE